jgi:hypothetical protein
MWYLERGVILTKDNLAKHNWQGSNVCCFCHKDEIIQHLFSGCRFDQAVWSVIHAALDLSQPPSVSNMFGSGCYLLVIVIYARMVSSLGTNIILFHCRPYYTLASYMRLYYKSQPHKIWLLRHCYVGWNSLPRHMSGGLVFELIVIKVFWV